RDRDRADRRVAARQRLGPRLRAGGHSGLLRRVREKGEKGKKREKGLGRSGTRVTEGFLPLLPFLPYFVLMIIDFHNHYYPPAYLDALRTGPSVVRITLDDAGNPMLHYPGDYNVAVPGHRDIAFRETDVTKQGVDLQVISLTT